MIPTDQVVNSVLHFPYSSIQFLADSNQCQYLSDECIKHLTFEATGVVRFLLQDAFKFTRKCRRTKMLTEDFESAMKLRYLDQIFGSRLTNRNLPFKTTITTGSNHREVQYIDDHQVQLDQVITSSLPKLPLDISLRAHWLAINGKQPTINENPEIISKSDMTADSLDSMKVLPKNRYNLDSTKIRTANPHELSLEQQIYYKEITEACVGSEEQKRQEAISSLTNETGLYQILPRLVLFISEGVKVNLIQNNLAILIYLMRMTNSLLENKSLYCEKYLHQLFPAVMSCILSRQLSARPDVDNHWALRDFAASRCAHMVKIFSANIHGLRNRIVRIFLNTLHDERLPLVTHYGALIGLCEMGQETIEELVFPIVRILGDRLAKLRENSSLDKITIDKINSIITKYIPIAYCTSHSSPDTLEYFKHTFSHYYGQSLYDSIIQIYQRTPTTQSYLQPPIPPPPSPVIIREIRPPQPPEVPPLVIHQRPPIPVTPPPIIIRERPLAPPPIESTRIVNKYLPAPSPPPRKVIIERHVPFPQKPQPIIIEKWLPFKSSSERRVVIEHAQPLIENSIQKNTVITYDPPHVDLVKNVRKQKQKPRYILFK